MGIPIFTFRRASHTNRVDFGVKTNWCRIWTRLFSGSLEFKRSIFISAVIINWDALNNWQQRKKSKEVQWERNKTKGISLDCLWLWGHIVVRWRWLLSWGDEDSSYSESALIDRLSYSRRIKSIGRQNLHSNRILW